MDAPTPGSAAFDTPVSHLYRGEMNRATVWRQRLDVTSNWAMISTFGLTSFTLGGRDIPHYTLVLGLALIAISLLLEARRYRHLHHSKRRLYLIEVGFFAELLAPADPALTDGARALLAADLRQPCFALSLMTAARLRLRRNYLMLIYFINAVWVAKLFVHPAAATSAGELYRRLAVPGFLPSWLVAVVAGAVLVGATAFALGSPPAERLEDWSDEVAGAAFRQPHTAA